MDLKVLIFGICGFVGRYLASEFHNNGYVVFGCDKDISSWNDNAVEVFESDIIDFNSVCSAINKVKPDCIVNLAAISSVSLSWNAPQQTIDINVIGSLNILEGCRLYSTVTKIMFIGSSEEYEASDYPIDEDAPLNANNPYGISKITQERFASLYRDRYGMKVYCVRPFNHTGVGQKDSFVIPSFCKQVAEIEKSGKPGTIKVGNLVIRRDFSHVKDVVRAYRMIIEKADCREIYNVGSGKAYSLEDILNYIISLSSQKIGIEIDPNRFRPVDTPIICCDNSKIKEDLGWSTEYSVFDAVYEIYKYYLNGLK